MLDSCKSYILMIIGIFHAPLFTKRKDDIIYHGSCLNSLLVKHLDLSFFNFLFSSNAKPITFATDIHKYNTAL